MVLFSKILFNIKIFLEKKIIERFFLLKFVKDFFSLKILLILKKIKFFLY